MQSFSILSKQSLSIPSKNISSLSLIPLLHIVDWIFLIGTGVPLFPFNHYMHRQGVSLPCPVCAAAKDPGLLCAAHRPGEDIAHPMDTRAFARNIKKWDWNAWFGVNVAVRRFIFPPDSWKSEACPFNLRTCFCRRMFSFQNCRCLSLLFLPLPRKNPRASPAPKHAHPATTLPCQHTQPVTALLARQQRAPWRWRSAGRAGRRPAARPRSSLQPQGGRFPWDAPSQQRGHSLPPFPMPFGIWTPLSPLLPLSQGLRHTGAMAPLPPTAYFYQPLPSHLHPFGP